MTPDVLAQWSTMLPALTQLPNPPRRIICHWTGGGPRANDIDRQSYHFIVEHDGRVVPGVHGIAANMRQIGRNAAYAAHTGGFNSFSIGLAFAGMAKWVPGGKTAFPLTKVQIETGIGFVALACRRYHLDPSNPLHLFTHTEAWTLHKVKGTVNDQKTDITHLPFLPALGPTQVGPYLRQLAVTALRALP
jgi:hypothetical protein